MPTENRSSNTEMVSAPREHELKIRQTPLADLLSGLKTGEIRDCSDREFAVGDTVLLREIDDGRDYTGTVARRTITHVQKHYGLPDHLCVLSYGQQAPQPHPEPIAWMVGTAFWWTKEEAERDAAATGLAMVPVGPLVSIPDGYCLMPKRLTAENGAKALLLGEFRLEVTRECPECLELDEPAEGCEICNGEGEYAQRHTIPWEKIKFIYSEAVKGLALQPHAIL
ncbi:DUF3850 domain-containing protein [Pseudomonas sp. SWRI100]|uniref:DUF3850 domain-containing protein n=1 Tax=Pseudomonas TaxID=286 RepID=UPI001647E80A|nr:MULTISPECIES: DUF3850 domain-containing protein [Pseudomonas]MBC3496828.1 DUF3850 domain-containing protein [Pseudomonas sp. SWRI67]MBV4526110.1 DUF3850 domain-containing protein [Pseudomonas kermanshahensis]